MTDEEKISELRRHLECITEIEPNTEVLGIIFFNRALTPEEFIDIFHRYKLSLGAGDVNISIWTPDGVAATALIEDHTNLSSLRKWVLNDFKHRSSFPVDSPESFMFRIETFSAYATTTHLLQLWRERPDIVRGIGVGGRLGGHTTRWRGIRPGEPIQ